MYMQHDPHDSITSACSLEQLRMVVEDSTKECLALMNVELPIGIGKVTTKSTAGLELNARTEFQC